MWERRSADRLSSTTSAGALTFGPGVADGANTLKYTATTLTGLSAGSKTLHENDIAGYAEGAWSCTGNADQTASSNFNIGGVTANVRQRRRRTVRRTQYGSNPARRMSNLAVFSR